MKLLIKNGIVIDPESKTEKKMDILAENGRITRVETGISTPADQVIDAAGSFVMPGFIDLHVHLRDPGLEYKEDIETGTQAAAHGGYTTIVAMPNTVPVADRPNVISYVHHKAEAVSRVHVYQAGAITQGQQGKVLADIEGMKQAGSPAISEDGKSVMNAQIYREAMQIAAQQDMAVLAHCEDINMVNGGVLNADEKSRELGLPGITNSVEDVIVARDIMLAKETGVRLHLCHCSTADSVFLVKEAKQAGISVTAEVCPHHFTLSSEDIPGDDANYKMNPPLRTKKDVEALREGLRQDIMDVIATDHAPHSKEEKSRSIRKAPFGIVGLETAAALTYTELVEPGILTMCQMAEKMSYNPAKVLGIADRTGSIQVGKAADLVVFDVKTPYTIDVSTFRSKGKNTPFDGKTVRGRVLATIIDGEIAYRETF